MFEVSINTSYLTQLRHFGLENVSVVTLFGTPVVLFRNNFICDTIIFFSLTYRLWESHPAVCFTHKKIFKRINATFIVLSSFLNSSQFPSISKDVSV